MPGSAAALPADGFGFLSFIANHFAVRLHPITVSVPTCHLGGKLSYPNHLRVFNPRGGLFRDFATCEDSSCNLRNRHRQSSSRTPTAAHRPRHRSRNKPKGIRPFSPVLVRQHLRREIVPQNNSFSASDGEKVAAGWMRCRGVFQHNPDVDRDMQSS